MLYIKVFNAPVAVATHSAAIRRKCWSPLVAKVAKVARANTMAGFIIFFHINDDFWTLWTLVLMMMLYRRSSSDPNWSVVVGSPRPQTKERPAVAGPCLICIFLLLRCNKEIFPFTFLPFLWLLYFHSHFFLSFNLTFSPAISPAALCLWRVSSPGRSSTHSTSASWPSSLLVSAGSRQIRLVLILASDKGIV